MTLSPPLLLHVCTGTVGFLSGAAGLAVRKGSGKHRVAGNIFSAAMLSVSASGAYMAIVKPVPINVIVGVLTFYLVATAWLTIKRPEREVSLVDGVALVIALAVAISALKFGWEAAHAPGGQKAGEEAESYYFFGFVALAAAVMDVSVLLRGGLFGAQRIARHLWRMCFALLIAAVSFLPRVQRMLPTSLRETNWLMAPLFLIMILTVFWLLRVWFSSSYKSPREAVPTRAR